jgi:glutamyl-tRNA reductase
VDADVVFVSTSAPHYLLTKDLLSWLLMGRKNKNDLLIIDLSNPRNVEETVRQLERVKLHGIDDLTVVAEQNKQRRQFHAEQAVKIVDEELELLERAIREDSVREIVSVLLSQIEETRQRELAKALSMMEDLDERQRKIVCDLTSIMLKQMFLPFVENIHRAAANNKTNLIEAAAKLLETDCY